MKYQILIKSFVNTNVAVLNWFLGSFGNTIWETENEQEAIQQYQDLLKIYPQDNLTLVNIIPVNVQVSL